MILNLNWKHKYEFKIFLFLFRFFLFLKNHFWVCSLKRPKRNNVTVIFCTLSHRLGLLCPIRMNQGSLENQWVQDRKYTKYTWDILSHQKAKKLPKTAGNVSKDACLQDSTGWTGYIRATKENNDCSGLKHIKYMNIHEFITQL